MTAKPWPNKLGWSVRVGRGEALVADCGGHLVATVPIAPTREPHPVVGRSPIVTDRRRVMRVPLGTDPIEAVRACQAAGEIIEV